MVPHSAGVTVVLREARAAQVIKLALIKVTGNKHNTKCIYGRTNTLLLTVYGFYISLTGHRVLCVTQSVAARCLK